MLLCKFARKSLRSCPEIELLQYCWILDFMVSRQIGFSFSLFCKRSSFEYQLNELSRIIVVEGRFIDLGLTFIYEKFVSLT